LPCTALRFFTVYGPFGRPDMALFKFTKNILDNKKIELFNNGNHSRDFTYIDDIVSGIYSVIKKPSKNKTPFNIFNIGNGNSRKLKDYLQAIEKKLGRKALIKKLPLQKGDIIKTHSDINSLNNFSNYKPKTNIQEGVGKFIDWFIKYYNY
jgi:UDP-glucuronate 4-epimerase